jgi:hypothetical protein
MLPKQAASGRSAATGYGGHEQIAEVRVATRGLTRHGPGRLSCVTTAGAGRCPSCGTTSPSMSAWSTSVVRRCGPSTAMTTVVPPNCWRRWRKNWTRTGRAEEDGLFAVFGTDALYAEHIGPLVREHRELAALLESLELADPRDRDRVRRAVHDLHEHIAKEEDGLFPASLTALGGDEWDAAMAAWQQAHPDRHLIGDA